MADMADILNQYDELDSALLLGSREECFQAGYFAGRAEALAEHSKALPEDVEDDLVPADPADSLFRQHRFVLLAEVDVGSWIEVGGTDEIKEAQRLTQQYLASDESQTDGDYETPVNEVVIYDGAEPVAVITRGYTFVRASAAALLPEREPAPPPRLRTRLRRLFAGKAA
jgi:hypothetical protein